MDIKPLICSYSIFEWAVKIERKMGQFFKNVYDGSINSLNFFV